MLYSKTYSAEGAIPTFRLVKFGSTDTRVALAAAATERIVGVYMGPEDAVDAQTIEVCLLGETFLAVSGAIGRGMRLTTNASGQGVTAETGQARTCAVALIAGSNANIPVFVFPGAEMATSLADTGDTGSGNYVFTGAVTSSALVNKTATYTATSSDQVITCDTTSAAVTINLPAVASTTIGKTYTIKRTTATANNVIVDGNSAETIDGAATKTITTQFGFITIVNTGTTWVVTGSGGTIT